MNILFYLLPKNEVAYIYSDSSLQQAMEKMESRRYSAVPMISREGVYKGTLTEGDILWEIYRRGSMDKKWAEEMPVSCLPRIWDNRPVNVNCEIEDLVMTSMNQNFVPVIDDNGIFIGIVTRKSIISYCYALCREQEAGRAEAFAEQPARRINPEADGREE